MAPDHMAQSGARSKRSWVTQPRACTMYFRLRQHKGRFVSRLRCHKMCRAPLATGDISPVRMQDQMADPAS
eukprot:5981998-Pyramimonas_sp.AAC.1